MSFTRFHDDPARIKKQVEESSFSGKYYLNVAGPGNYVPFFEDPQFRLQKFGTNIRTNTINLESDLLGLTRKINHNFLDSKTYEDFAVSSRKVDFPVKQPIVEESRASHPAWMYRDLEQSNWSYPQLNPQFARGSYQQGSFGLPREFNENISTRILEKDYYVPRIPVVSFKHNDILPNNEYLDTPAT
jgi:hypothetical protein